MDKYDRPSGVKYLTPVLNEKHSENK